MNIFIFGDNLSENDKIDLGINNFFKIAKIKIDIKFILVFDTISNDQTHIRNMITKNFEKIPEYKTCNFRGKKSLVAIFWNV